MAPGGNRITRALLRCGPAAGAVFLGAAALQAARRPGYRAMRHPISSLALGGRGGAQVANFAVTGTLCAAFAAGLSRARPADVPRSAPVLIASAAAGLLVCGACPADPVNGYPPGTPPAPEVMTGHGIAHLVASSVVMIGVPATTMVCARRARRTGERRWARLSGLATAVTAGAFGAASAGFAQVGVLPRCAGGLQRIAVAVGFAWLGALGVRTLRSLRPTALPGS